jgi:hypothetical protein
MLINSQEWTYRDLRLGDHVPHDKSRGTFKFSVNMTTEEYANMTTSLLDLTCKESAPRTHVWVDAHREWMANSVKVNGVRSGLSFLIGLLRWLAVMRYCNISC